MVRRPLYTFWKYERDRDFGLPSLNFEYKLCTRIRKTSNQTSLNFEYKLCTRIRKTSNQNSYEINTNFWLAVGFFFHFLFCFFVFCFFFLVFDFVFFCFCFCFCCNLKHNYSIIRWKQCKWKKYATPCQNLY